MGKEMKNKSFLFTLLITFQIFQISNIFSQNFNGNHLSNFYINNWLNYPRGEVMTSIAEEGNYLWIGTFSTGLVKFSKDSGENLSISSTA